MTKEFIFIGENKDDDQHLLVRGEDGKYYDYQPARDYFEPVEPDNETWEITMPDAATPEDETGAAMDLDFT